MDGAAATVAARPRRPAISIRGVAAFVMMLGCPTPGSSTPRPTNEQPPSAPDDLSSVADPSFRRRAHASALAALRLHSGSILRQLDPVAAADVDHASVHPPRFDPASRHSQRDALTRALREADGISATQLDAPSAMVLRVLRKALTRGQHRLYPPPHRDDPTALLYALEPYVDALERSMADQRCSTPDCGLRALAVSLRDGWQEIGASALPSLQATGEDLNALRRRMVRWTVELDDDHPRAQAMNSLDAVLTDLQTQRTLAARALAQAPEEPWNRPVEASSAEHWVRCPARWNARRLRIWLDEEEDYGHDPALLMTQMEATLARLHAMGRRPRPHDEPPAHADPSAIFDRARCEYLGQAIESWAQTRRAMVVALDCPTIVRAQPPELRSEAATILHLITHAVIGPTRRARVEHTAPEIALVRGRATAHAQQAVLLIAVTAGIPQFAPAYSLALRRAHHDACLAATAIWIHAQLGTNPALQDRLDPYACGKVGPLIAAAEARPRTALLGLGLVLLGDGPADAAALSRYWWAPIGLVLDLAQPPSTSEHEDSTLRVRVEPLNPDAKP